MNSKKKYVIKDRDGNVLTVSGWEEEIQDGYPALQFETSEEAEGFIAEMGIEFEVKIVPAQKTYFLPSIQFIREHPEHFGTADGIVIPVRVEDNEDYLAQTGVNGCQSYTNTSWVIADSFESACEKFREWIEEYVTLENINFEEIEAPGEEEDGVPRHPEW